jgi:hypothetical protein
MNLFQKIVFYLWFLGTLGIVLLFWVVHLGPLEPGTSLPKEFILMEGGLTLVLGFPFLLFKSTPKK